MKQSGLSLTDSIGLEAILLVNGMASVLGLKLLAGKGPQITELNQRISGSHITYA
jgi:hypothetical protein